MRRGASGGCAHARAPGKGGGGGCGCGCVGGCLSVSVCPVGRAGEGALGPWCYPGRAACGAAPGGVGRSIRASLAWGGRLWLRPLLEVWETRVVPAPRPSATSGAFTSPLKMAAGLRGGSRGDGRRASAAGGGAPGAGWRGPRRPRVGLPGVCGQGGSEPYFRGFILSLPCRGGEHPVMLLSLVHPGLQRKLGLGMNLRRGRVRGTRCGSHSRLRCWLGCESMQWYLCIALTLVTATHRKEPGCVCLWMYRKP